MSLSCKNSFEQDDQSCSDLESDPQINGEQFREE